MTPIPAPAAAAPKANAPVNVINHLVKKRPTTDTAASPAPPAKSAATEPKPTAQPPAPVAGTPQSPLSHSQNGK